MDLGIERGLICCKQHNWLAIRALRTSTITYPAASSRVHRCRCRSCASVAGEATAARRQIQTVAMAAHGVGVAELGGDGLA